MSAIAGGQLLQAGVGTGVGVGLGAAAGTRLRVESSKPPHRANLPEPTVIAILRGSALIAAIRLSDRAIERMILPSTVDRMAGKRTTAPSLTPSHPPARLDQVVPDAMNGPLKSVTL
jgi:hypothetical protein